MSWGCIALGTRVVVGTALGSSLGPTCRPLRRRAVGRLPVLGHTPGPWAAAGLAVPGPLCCCRFLNGLLPFGSTELRCNPGQFACRSGAIQCIPLPWQCDGWVTCEDESDEADCPGECVGQAAARGPAAPSQLRDRASRKGGWRPLQPVLDPLTGGLY